MITTQVPPSLRNGRPYGVLGLVLAAVLLKSAISVSTAETYGPHLPVPTWDQGNPSTWQDNYNQFVPTVRDEPAKRFFVGCVATALAQVLDYWEYPDSVEFLDSDRFTTRFLGYRIDADEGIYDYPDFADLNGALDYISYDGSMLYKAWLSFAAGVSVRTDYGCSYMPEIKEPDRYASGAYLSDMRAALESKWTFGSAELCYGWQWNERRQEVIENLMDGWPVILGIGSDESGHAVVADGYDDSRDLFHINFGWGTEADDWYTLPSFTDTSRDPTRWTLNEFILNVSPDFSWTQHGGDERKLFRTPYPISRSAPTIKWERSLPAEIADHAVGEMIVTEGGSLLVAANPWSTEPSSYSLILRISPRGEIEKVTKIDDADAGIDSLVQTESGSVYFGSSKWGEHRSLYALDPKSGSARIVKTIPDGYLEGHLTSDSQGRVFGIAQPGMVGDSYIAFAVTQENPLRGWEVKFGSAYSLEKTMVSVDQGRNRVYVTAAIRSDRKGSLWCLRADNGSVLWSREFRVDESNSSWPGPAVVRDDGHILIGANSELYRLSPENGDTLASASFAPAYTGNEMAVGRDGTIFINIGKLENGVWHPVVLRAVDSDNMKEKWQMAFPTGDFDHTEDLYVGRNSVVVMSYVDGDQKKLVAVEDQNSHGTELWNLAYGGGLAFGTERTIYTTLGTRIAALTGGSHNGFVDDQAPAQPVIESLAAGVAVDPSKVDLTWRCSDPDGHPLSYDIYLGAASGNSLGLIPLMKAGHSQPRLSVQNLKPGVVYAWRVVATDGQMFSKPANGFFTTQGDNPPPPALQPGPGVFQRAIVVTASSALGTTIRYTTDGSDPTSNSPVFPAAGFQIAVTTELRARAFSSSGASSSITGGTYTIECSPPPPPIGVSATDGEFCKSVRVRWTLVPEADSYALYMDDRRYGDWFEQPPVDVPVPDKIPHKFTVRSKNACGNSGHSNPDTGFAKICNDGYYDFNRDDLPDLLFQDSSGYVAYWSMQGCKLSSAGLFKPSQGAGLSLVTGGNLTEEGGPDLVFQQSDWKAQIWRMEGLSRLDPAVTIPRAAALNWHLVSAGDFDRDGDPDLLFQHSKGNMVCWIMENGDWQSDILVDPLNPGDPGWRVVGSGDFNRDTQPDLVFQHTDATLAVWMMNGLRMTSAQFLQPAHPDNANWRVGAVTDLDKDGDADLVFQFRGTGELATWLMDGTRLQQACWLNPPKPGGTWKLVGPK